MTEKDITEIKLNRRNFAYGLGGVVAIGAVISPVMASTAAAACSDEHSKFSEVFAAYDKPFSEGQALGQDISCALNPMLQNLSNAGGGVVDVPVPAGCYRIVNPIVIPTGVSFLGQGLQQSKPTIPEHCFVLDGGSVGITTAPGANYVFIDKIRVDVKAEGGVAFEFRANKRGEISNCMALLHVNSGVCFRLKATDTSGEKGIFYGHYSNLHATNKTESAVSIGFHLLGASENGQVNACVLDNCSASGVGYGYRIENSNANSIRACSAERIGHTSVSFQGTAARNIVSGLYLEGFGETDVEFEVGTDNNEVYMVNNTPGGMGGTRRINCNPQGNSRNIWHYQNASYIDGPTIYSKFDGDNSSSKIMTFRKFDNGTSQTIQSIPE